MLLISFLIPFWKMFDKKPHQRPLLILTTWIFLSLSAFAEEQEVCDSLKPWRVPVCATTEEERTKKTDLLHTLLSESLTRKKILPEKVIEAGQAVFRIGFQHTFQQWSWNFSGGSGFFMFNNRTFFTNHHVVKLLLENISHWNEIVFKNQTGEEEEFQIKRVKFISKIYDVAVLEVEGYEGPVLEPATETPREQSYALGYPENFDIQSARNTFELTPILYGAFPELFDCYYDTRFEGFSGGPMVNREGKVESVFSGIFSGYKSCPVLMTRRLNFLTEEIKTNTKGFDSIEQAKEMILKNMEDLIALAKSGNREIRFGLLIDGVIIPHDTTIIDPLRVIMEAAAEGNRLAWHTIIGLIDEERMSFFVTNPVSPWRTSLPQTLHITWYEMGIVAYYTDDNLKKACNFWKKATQLEHPYIYENFVFVPGTGDIISCEF